MVRILYEGVKPGTSETNDPTAAVIQVGDNGSFHIREVAVDVVRRG